MSVFIYDELYSQLYNLQPIGIGTSTVESLTSYISRLADIHCITTGTLVSKILAPALNKEYMLSIAKRGGNGFYDCSNGINGIGTMARDFIDVMNCLTSRCDLSNTTISKWLDLFPTRGLLRKTKAWCPLCLQDAMNKKEIIYDQLMWSIGEVNVCLIHQERLINQCQVCRKTIPFLSRRTKPGFCSNCNSWLGAEKNITDNKIPKNNEDFQKSIMVANFIVDSFNVDIKYNRELISIALKHFISVVMNGNKSRTAKMMGLSKSTFTGWVNGNNIPQLSSILMICNFFRISLHQFLLMDERPINEVGLVGINESVPINKRQFDHHIIKKMLKFIIKHQVPISIKKVSEIIGCDRKLLYKKHTQECVYIREIYETYVNQTSMDRLNRKLKQIEESFNGLIQDSIYPSRRKMEQKIGSPLLIEGKLRKKWELLKITNNI